VYDFATGYSSLFIQQCDERAQGLHPKSHPRKIVTPHVYLVRGKCTLCCRFHFSESCSQNEERSKSTYYERRWHPWQGQNSGSRCPMDSTEMLLAAMPSPLACSSSACLPPAYHTGSLCPFPEEFRPLQDNRHQRKRPLNRGHRQSPAGPRFFVVLWTRQE
jgi:hypothetical protein